MVTHKQGVFQAILRPRLTPKILVLFEVCRTAAKLCETWLSAEVYSETSYAGVYISPKISLLEVVSSSGSTGESKW